MSRELEKRLISIRRHLHQYPELSNEEFETTKSIQTFKAAHFLFESAMDILSNHGK
ncbi:hypothetical protein J7J00_03940 [Bacillus sp. ISL-4]|nr:hypothetical protein [Bacillus sp. ISL-4]MBT2671604.1 hypothetical protein [Streptomyces sp. ISL-14]